MVSWSDSKAVRLSVGVSVTVWLSGGLLKCQ